MMQIDLLNNAFLVFVSGLGFDQRLYRLENDDGFGLIDTGNST